MNDYIVYVLVELWLYLLVIADNAYLPLFPTSFYDIVVGQ
jgi:hypothetical protein